MVSAMADGFEPLKSDEDIEEILRLAVRDVGFDGGNLRDRLNASASELGISADVLAQAEKQWIDRRQGELTKEQELEDRKMFKKLRVGDFVSHLGSYLAVNAFLMFIDLRKGGIDWAFWPLLGWGIGLFIHMFSLFGHGADQERDFQRWQKKRRKKES